jgi:uncharacterized phage protein (TIGR01671 family)
MREIKFRAWDKQDKVMRSVYAILYPNYYQGARQRSKTELQLHCSEIDHDMSSFYRPLEDCELMQYTGLKDKNGKEIYEGDIVQGTSYLYGYQLKGGKQFDYLGKVVWQDQEDVGLCWQLEDAKGGAWNLNQTVHRNELVCTGEVSGNIYENKDLL